MRAAEQRSDNQEGAPLHDEFHHLTSSLLKRPVCPPETPLIDQQNARSRAAGLKIYCAVKQKETLGRASKEV